MANRQVIFLVTKLTYNAMRVIARNSLERSNTVYVQNSSLSKLDIYSTSLHGDRGAEHEDGVQISPGDSLTYNY